MLHIALATLLSAVSPGRYALEGEARVEASVLGSRTERVQALALVGPGAGPGEVALRVMARGYDCDLVARVDAEGQLSFAPGQRCPVQVKQPQARGRVEARLREGGGQLAGRDLALSLSFDLDGGLSARIGQVGLLDRPGVWGPEVPVGGTLHASARGRRDEPAPPRRGGEGPARVEPRY